MTPTDARAFFDRYGPMVHRRAFSILGSDADAQEATQEVFIRALSGLEAFDDPRTSLSTWMYRITTNYCLNKLRDAKRRRELWEQHVSPTARTSTRAGDRTDLVALRRVLAEADPEQSAAAVYVYVDGMSHAEAADALGVSRRTVGNLIVRFLSFAKGRLAPAGGGP